jgi:adenylosuccinate synthase
VPEFDTAHELDTLKQLRERMVKGNMIVDSIDFMSHAIKDPKQRIIAEGANACMLDIDYGTFPYVTSSSTTIGGVCTGLGVPPQEIKTNIGIMKAYTTRVGGGPFPTELEDEVGTTL